MIIPHRLRRAALPGAAFVLITTGALLALPSRDDGADNIDRVPTVVARDAIAAGTDTAEFVPRLEVRMLEPDARADGAFGSLEEIPDGVLAAPLARGQQVLTTSVTDNVVTAVGKGYVSVSVRLDSQRWTGPMKTTGESVDIHAIDAGVATLVSPAAVVLDSPDMSGLEPRDDAIVTLAVRSETLDAVLVAAMEDKLWLTGR